MHTRLIRRSLGTLAIAALAYAATPTTGAGPVPAETYTRVITADVAHLGLLVDLHKANPTDKNIPSRIKATAILLAAYAQENLDGTDGDRMAALRAQALKVAEAVAKKDWPGMVSAADGVKNVAAEPKADKKAMKLYAMHKVDLREIMNLYEPPKKFGLNMEKDIRDMKKDGVTDAKLVELIGIRSVIISDLTINLPPRFTAKRKKEDWEQWMKDMKAQSVEMTAEASKGPKADLAKLKKMVTALDGTCVKCHNTFRDP